MKATAYNNPLSKLTKVEAEFGDQHDIQKLMEAVKERIVIKLVDKFVDLHGNEIIASIDLAAIKSKTNEKVTIAALKELVK